MLVDVYSKEGKVVGQIELRDDVFAVEPHEHAMHMAVVAFLANQRQGTHKTKVRSEVRGGGKKPWRQKGRGTARAGSIRSPLWVHGGTIHGPKPRDYSMKINKKLKTLARKSALSLRLQEGNLLVLEDFQLEKPKTKEFYQVLKNLNLNGEKTLILLPENAKELYLSARNIDKVSVLEAEKVSTYHILAHKKLLIFKSAVEQLQATFTN
ncbi:50S ribosomal protein L4 [Bacteroidetes/Chlorobi group bacterium Naka2016]|jgi:large subunit ribosomal protein L4|nr:MAG: 50S ribosomal protein L4 [Bacteroidetes/Chlorobi group bacterium Naka2016]